MHLISTLRYAISAAIGLIYPNLCVICNKESKITESIFCVHCLSRLPFTRFENSETNEFTAHFEPNLKIEYGIAIFHLNPASGIAKMIHAIKYNNKPGLAKDIGSFVGDILIKSSLDLDFDVIVPVPLHPKKQRERGYNQSEMISLGLAKKLKIKIDNTLLLREKNTVTQTSLNKGQRMKNTLNAFRINDMKPRVYKHVLLVDDVMTTGSTLRACALALTADYDVRISMLSIALGN